jgi:mutator protein MutT
MNKQITVFSGCLIQDGKVLLVQRDEEECKDAHMKWEFPGGKVDFGETPEQAIVREFEEETGYRVKVEKLLPYVATNYWDYAWGRQQTLCFVFVCNFIKEVTHKKDHHVNKIKWFSFDEVAGLSSLPGTVEILKMAKK